MSSSPLFPRPSIRQGKGIINAQNQFCLSGEAHRRPMGTTLHHPPSRPASVGRRPHNLALYCTLLFPRSTPSWNVSSAVTIRAVTAGRWIFIRRSVRLVSRR
nr:unnamed protein product [Digitaria exilis]